MRSPLAHSLAHAFDRGAEEPDDPRKDSKLGFLKGVFDDNVGIQKST